MNKGLIITLVLGTLASMPAHAWTWNNATYESRFQPVQTASASATTAKPQTSPAQATPEIQVAVMGKSPSQPVASQSGADLWYGTGQHSRATHSR